MSRSRLPVRLLAAALAVGLVAAGGWAWWSSARDDGGAESVAVGDAVGPVEHRYVIPPGTAERVAAGEQVDVIPLRIEAMVGETIEIVNEDDRVNQVGVFVVGPGQTVRQRFTTPGVLEGACDVHPQGTFTIEVAEPA